MFATQFSTLAWWFGGYHSARLIHFLSMCGPSRLFPVI
jgi:thiosulfate reductase cytochrome b subunit